MAVYFALLEPGDTIMGMKLSHGGHLTHGHPKITFSGRFYNSVQYTVDPETNLLNYEEIGKLARKVKPKLIIAGYSAYPRIVDWKAFSEIGKSTGAYLLADVAHIAGLIVAGVHPSPVGYADIITTTTHKTLRGPRGAIIMTNNEELASKIDRAVFPGLQGGPHDQQTAAIAVCLGEAAKPEFKKYGEQVVANARELAEYLSNFGFNLVTGGTDTHLILVDLRNKGISGKEAQDALEQAGITVNKNTIPFDSAPPAAPSGIRLGTPAVTTRGMKEGQMKTIAGCIDEVIKNTKDKSVIKRIRSEVKEFLKSFPIK
ncbi:MAG: glycine hydroxymethyltransferase [Microgenomates group bacterium LiPW_16]|nr:MAG: glycine hydroxymethyltransferase [Microgenomates group bacterium LiPW_16]